MDNTSLGNIGGQKPEKPWYKRFWGVVLLVFLSLLALFVLVFAGFFGYYAWQIKFGDAEKVAKQFVEERFSTDQSLLGSGKESGAFVANFEQYIRGNNPSRGSKDAPVTIISFIDFECPFCHQAHTDFESMVRKYDSVVRVVFKHLPLRSIHPDSNMAANASVCAFEQGKFWEYYNELFLTKDLSSVGLLSSAKNVGVGTEMFSLCLATEKYQKDIQQDIVDAIDLGLKGTPTHIVNGYKVEGATTLEVWDKILVQLLQNTI